MHPRRGNPFGYKELVKDHTMLEFKFSDISDLLRRTESGKIYASDVENDADNRVPMKPHA